MKRNYSIFLCLFFCHIFLCAQKNDCESITSFLNKKENQIKHLNLYDPDYIPLHYFIAQDIIKELKQFKNEVITNYSECETISFNALLNKFEELNNRVVQKYDSLVYLNANVYLLFYEKAFYEYFIGNVEEGKYLLDRSLQYNPTFPNAVLLKLNKLLDNNFFNESLSLLNTLYYETELDDEQEKQAIEFTDKFYYKLYKTGDSLLKIEHAAEALELFEVLEVFCQNLPTTYCNDDYFHGVLNSKTGIYDSYLAIAKVAEKRGNSQIASRFYQYAQEYLDNNPHLKNYEPKEKEMVESVSPIVEQISISVEKNEEPESVIVQSSQNSILSETEINTPHMASPKELKERYDNMVFQALVLCIKEDFSASYKMFLQAKELENCKCFDPDFRVDLMIKELITQIP